MKGGCKRTEKVEIMMKSFVDFPTLKISNHDFVVVGAGEQIVGSRRKAH